MHMDSTLGGSTFTPCSQTSHAPEARGHSGSDADATDAGQLQAHLTRISAENRELRAELDQARADKARLTELLARISEVLGSKSHDRLVHDLRNVLNERELYRALADSIM